MAARPTCATLRAAGRIGSRSSPQAATISGVRIYNRKDWWQDRLGHYQIWVGEHAGHLGVPCNTAVHASQTCEQCEAFDVEMNKETCRDKETCGGYHVRDARYHFDSRKILDHVCDAPVGRFVTILLPGTGRVLNLAEVIVYGSALDPPSPPAAPAPLAPPPDMTATVELRGGRVSALAFRGLTLAALRAARPSPRRCCTSHRTPARMARSR